MAYITNLVESYPLLYAAMGGILPALFWLWFWIQEDKLNPEPRGRIFMAFLGGMIAVILVYPLERFVHQHFGAINTSTIFAWSVIEEFAKYLIVAIIALHSKDFDEPLDAMTYIITVALGFAALENTLFILHPLLSGEAFQSFVTGNERFIGASLLHVVCSGIIGFFLGLAFYKNKIYKMIYRVFGIMLAVALHAAFNLFIIYKNGQKTLFVFSVLWILVLVILLLFERIKKVKAP
ncbi:MAG TPA: PrsW family glutamic-type intramembrane protease [Candidatus Paceibacterota bacterium]